MLLPIHLKKILFDRFGADVLIRAALSEESSTAGGRYFDNDNGVFAPIQADAAQATAVMQALSKITGHSVWT